MVALRLWSQRGHPGRGSHDNRGVSMSAPLIVSAYKIIEGTRKTYQSIPPDDAYAQSVVLKVAATLLGLEGEDYVDLVRHLVTAEYVEADALKWATTVQ
jgi:hypothetical protein